MKEFVLDLIEKKKRRYQEDYSEMLGDYNRELETVKGYNGRQILELLQNCDDEKARSVSIKLDLDAKTITVSNDGESFSEKGYRSLFIANLSAKTSKKKYIGNKGLGFRSIINWSDTIEIQSNGISLTYSEQNVAYSFKKLFSAKLRKQIRLEENLSEDVVPIPFLSMPIINEISDSDFATSIIIHYKNEFLGDIRKQVQKITSETLLFLRNIEEIKFEGFEDKIDINCKREVINKKVLDFAPKGKIIFDDYKWYIFEEERTLPKKLSDSDREEEEYYQIKIAVEENFKKSSSNLYSFFPTNIRLEQPYVLHATFDLDATRNQINDSNKNKFILERIVDFTISVAKFYSSGKASYRPLEILYHKHRADTLENLGYYDLIQNAIKTESVFPCIDNNYRTLEEVIFVSDDFAAMLIAVKAADILNVHLLPLTDDTLKESILNSKIDRTVKALKDAVGLINQIGLLKLTSTKRALFVAQIIKECQFLKYEHPNKINFLINDDSNVINGDEYIYTPITLNNKLRIPSYTNIQFINKNFFELLLNHLDYNKRENPNKGRFIYDHLKGFCNIHSYEPTTLALKIISETNKAVKKRGTNSLDYIREMNQCLYSNFKKADDDAIKSVLPVSVPTITKNKKVKFTEDVCLSEAYPTGKKTVVIFKGIYTNADYVSNPLNLGITDFTDINEVEQFLIWLGVNKFVKYVEDNNTDSEGYYDYVRKYKGIYDSTSQSLRYRSINNFELILNKLSVSKLILWIFFDDVFRKQIDNLLNDDEIKNFYRSYTILTDKPSFIKFLVDTKYSVLFKNVLIDDRYYWVNEFNIDYRDKEFIENGLTKSAVNEILVLLGAKDDFNAISIEKLAEIINKISIQFPDGKKSQSLYKKALNHYKINKIELKQQLNLYADNGAELKLYPQKNIFFNDKIKLPKRLKQDFPIFNFPSRAGGTEAIKFFGINDLKQVKIEIISHSELKENTYEFREYFSQLKPLILTQRISDMDEDNSKTQAGICSKIEIILCEDITYKVLEKVYEVADYEFLHFENETYYVKIDKNDSLVNLRKNFSFTESFADILSLSFDVSGDKNDFKHLIRNDFEYVVLNIKNDFGDDILQEARELLGLAGYKQAFWKAVFEVKGLEYFEHIDDLSLESLIYKNFNIKYNLSAIDYENINQKIQLKKIQALFEDLGIKLEDFSKKYFYEISMKDMHYNLLTNSLLSQKKLIKSSIWHYLKNSDIKSKSQFLSEINKFENFENFAETVAQQNEYIFVLNLKAITTEYINSRYPDVKISKTINLDLVKSKNLQKFNEDEIYEISQSERFKSLIYFKDAIKTIKEELEKGKLLSSKSIIINAPDYSDDEVYTVSSTIISSDKLKLKKIPLSSVKNSKVYTPKVKDDRKLKELGNSSEKVVYDHLLNDINFENVYWASQDNEGLHYDIRYTDNSSVVKYVEVKTFDNSYFHLSKPEYDFGLNHIEDYEIWLVNDKKNIFQIKDFFSNKKYEIISNEYLVYLEIENS